MMLDMRLFVAIPGGCVLGLGLSGILYSIPALTDVGPVLLIGCAAAGLGLGLIVGAVISRD